MDHTLIEHAIAPVQHEAISPFGSLMVLLVDDDPSVLKSLRRLLEYEPYEKFYTTSSQQALEIVADRQIAVIVSDRRMPEIDGILLLEKIHRISPQTIRIMLTADSQSDTVIDAINRGKVDHFLTKPWNSFHLKNALIQGLREFDLKEQNRKLSDQNEKQAETLFLMNKKLETNLLDLTRSKNQLEESQNREIEIGTRIQQTLLLESPPQELVGVEIAQCLRPSQEIDGDFIDYIKYRPDCFDMIVGDVMGKGVPAALLSAAIKTQFMRSIGSLQIQSPANAPPSLESVVNKTHEEITKLLIELESFATLFYIRVDLSENRIEYIGCGHPPIVFFEAKTGLSHLLPSQHMPLGFSLDEKYEKQSISFFSGDALLLYSDGLTETRTPQGEFYGEKRLLTALQKNGWQTPEKMVHDICLQVENFAAPNKLHDDLTCVAIRYVPQDKDLPIVLSRSAFTSELKNLREIRQNIREIIGIHLSADRCFEFEVALSEATSNIIKHVHNNSADEQFEIEVTVFADRIQIALRYEGEPFDPTQAPLPSFDGSKESGFGLYIISKMVDSFTYFQEMDHKNCICLVKHI